MEGRCGCLREFLPSHIQAASIEIGRPPWMWFHLVGFRGIYLEVPWSIATSRLDRTGGIDFERTNMSLLMGSERFP